MISIDGSSLSIDDLVQVARDEEEIKLSDDAIPRIQASCDYIRKKIKSDTVTYGVNTGFGDLCSVKVPDDKLLELQANIIRSHASGIGKFLDVEVVRATMLLRINTLANGYSSVRLKLIETLIEMLNKNLLPIVPSQGSVGASGDLIPLAHIALGLIGEGQVVYGGKQKDAKEAFNEAGIEPVVLEGREGLALINGTQLMTAIGALVIYDAKRLVKHCDIAAAMSCDSMKGTNANTHPLIHKLRPFEGQNNAAANIRKLMDGSEIMESHKGCCKVQDAYSLRCAPQVHGASRDAIDYVERVITTEMNSVTDNPIVNADEDEILNGGNFHGQPVAIAMDFLGIAISELGNISERRTARLVDHKLSECLPPFLIEKNGLNSGMMIPQYAAAALVSENKVLAHPASVDSIPTSANQEDHVSMGTIASRKCRTILRNTTNVLAVEFMCAAQGLEFHRPMKSSAPIESAHKAIRGVVPKLDEDRVMHDDIVKIEDLIKSHKIVSSVEESMGTLK